MMGVCDPPSAECAPQVFTQKGLMVVSHLLRDCYLRNHQAQLLPLE